MHTLIRALFVFFIGCHPALAATINVKPADDLQKVLDRSKDGDALVFEPKTYVISKTIYIRKDNLKLLGNGATFDSKMPRDRSAFDVTRESSGTQVRHFKMKTVNKSFGFTVHGSNTTIDNARALKNGGCFIKASASTDLTFKNSHCEVLSTLCLYAGEGLNKNLVIDNVTTEGSIYEHSIRLHSTENAVIKNSTLRNPQKALWAIKKGSALNLRDGIGAKIENTIVDGSSVIGPLADGDGGINLPPGPKRDQMLALRTKNPSFYKVQFLDYVMIEAGVENMKIDQSNFKNPSTGAGGRPISFEWSYGPRKKATGIISNTKMVGSKKPTIPDTVKLHGVTYNGSPL